ncbi:DNA adenine methylase [Shewanella phage Thanatos-2]|nr:DNA adenine methylase [Shewanella phage Thanatos-2]
MINYKDGLNGCYMNYVGNKWRYMEEIHKRLPGGNLKALDLFCGGAVVSSHFPKNWNITINDLNNRLVNLHIDTQNDSFLDHCLWLMDRFDLSKSNKGGYFDLRANYNDSPSSEMLYMLLCHSFSNQIRFNPKGEFNLPFGNRTFNKNLKEKLRRFKNRISERAIKFTSNNFDHFDFDSFDFVFVDPPYLEAANFYGADDWSLTDEKILLDKLKNTKAKWMLTNQTISKGKKNKLLVDFINQGNFNVHELRDTTKTCNYQRKGGETVEVLITNY